MDNYDLFDNMLIENLSEAVMLFDMSGRAVYANNAARAELGCGDEYCGYSIERLFPMIDNWQSESTAIIENAVVYRENQTCFTANIKGLWLKTGDERVYAVFAVNISKQTEYEQRWRHSISDGERAIKAKNEFAGNITHELRTPLNGINGLIEQLSETELSPMQRDSVKVVLNCCNNMINIVNNILDATKLAEAKIVPERIKFDLHKALQETMEFHAQSAQEKGIKLLSSVSAEVPLYVIGDELRLKQILNNLLSNAIKFTSVGHIAVEVSVTGGQGNQLEIFFVVMDTGIGISEEEKDKLFKNFSQVDSSISRRFGGTGLGLSIAKQLVELMGGTISVESVKNKGSVFSFSIIFERAEEEICTHEESVEKVFGGDYVTITPSKDRLAEQEVMYNLDDKSQKDFLKEMAEKLILCAELKLFDKAEHFAKAVKDMLPKDSEARVCALKLLLATRKLAAQESLLYAQELYNLIER